MTQDNETASSPAPPSVPWVSTQHEMEAGARPIRTRMFRLRMKSGTWRIASVHYLEASARSTTDARLEHLYRLQLQWLAEFDPRDGKAHKLVDRSSPNRSNNVLQFRVLEMPAATAGKILTAARLGPRGQIAADPPGIGLMSLLRGLLVQWVAEHHPDASIVSGSLYQVDVQSEDALALRDSFFTKSGFTIKPISGGSGTFSAPSIQVLRSSWNTDKAVELTPDLLAEAVCAQLELPPLRQQVARLQEVVVGLSKEKRATEVLSRIWLAVAVIAVVLGLIFGIQPRLG